MSISKKTRDEATTARSRRKMSPAFKLASQRNWQKGSLRGMRLRLRQIQLTTVGSEYEQLGEAISLLDKTIAGWNEQSRKLATSASIKLQTEQNKVLDSD